MSGYNFNIAMFNQNVIDPSFTLPWLGKRTFLPLSLQVNIDRVFDAVVYDDKANVCITASNYEERVEDLQWRFRSMAVVNLLLAPGILVFRAAYFVFRYLNDWRRQPHTLATRQWTPWARWRMREFCEMDHVFEDRLARAHKPATEYVGMFYSELGSILARFSVFVCGGVVVVLLILAFRFDEDFFLTELSPDGSVAFWIGLLGMAMALTSPFIRRNNVVFAPAAKLEETAKHIHTYPDEWKTQDAGSLTVYHQFTAMFSYRLIQFLDEILAIVITPYMLWFVLPGSARAIATYFVENTQRRPLIGDVCQFALFETSTTNDKMELSMINFRQHYPTWQPTTDNQRHLISQQAEFMRKSLTASVVADSVMLH